MVYVRPPEHSKTGRTTHRPGGQPFFGFRPLELIVAAVVLAQDEIASRGFVYQYARGAGAQSKTHTNRQQGQVLLCYSHRLSEELRGWI